MRIYSVMMWMSFSSTTVCCRSITSLAFSRSSISSIRKHKRVSSQGNNFFGLLWSSSTSTSDAADSSPWSNSGTLEKRRKKTNNQNRFRQHVNPLASRFQQPTVLTEEWPLDVFRDMTLPLHLDIGCGKGGFLLDMAEACAEKNYLGLEIRPSVAELAQERVGKRNMTGRLCFLGCNANVDLDRLLTRHREAAEDAGRLEMVFIQFPDPHFKSRNAKRRVVTDDLVTTLAKFMPQSSRVFLQSDVKSVLDDMRARFRDHGEYYQDEVANVEGYMESNVLGIATERERSVLEKNLPVYRTMFRRTSKPFIE